MPGPLGRDHRQEQALWEDRGEGQRAGSLRHSDHEAELVSARPHPPGSGYRVDTMGRERDGHMDAGTAALHSAPPGLPCLGTQKST